MHVHCSGVGRSGAKIEGEKSDHFYQIRIFDGISRVSESIRETNSRSVKRLQASILILVDTKNDYGKVLWCFNRTLVAIIYLDL